MHLFTLSSQLRCLDRTKNSRAQNSKGAPMTLRAAICSATKRPRMIFLYHAGEPFACPWPVAPAASVATDKWEGLVLLKDHYPAGKAAGTTIDAITQRPVPLVPIAILGAGISGLAASISSGAPVYEAEDVAGGVAASDTVQGFTFDRGIHILQAASTKTHKVLEDAGVRLNSRSRQAFIYSHGAYTAYPFQVNTARLPLMLRLRCVWDFLNREGRKPDSQPGNYEEWIIANLGRGFADTFLVPYSDKFWTVHPREMTHEWTGNRVPQPTTMQVLRGALWNKQTRIGTNVDFQYPVNGRGYGSITEALSLQCSAIHLGHRAKRLDTRNNLLHFENGSVIAYRQLISTIPLPELVAICDEAPNEVRAAAAQLRANSILVVNLGIGRAPRSGWHWVHFPQKEEVFFRISFPHNLADNVTPTGMSSVSAEVAYSSERPINHATIVDQVVDDLIRVGLVRRDDPIVYRATCNIRYAYCIHDFARKEAVRTVRNWMIERNVIPTGRYGLWNYFWSHESMMSGLQAGRKAHMTTLGAGEELAADDTFDGAH